MENIYFPPSGSFKSIGRRLSLTIACACLVLALLVGFLCYGLYRRQVITSTGGTALAVAKTLAAAIDGDEYASSMEKGERDAFWTKVKTIINKTHGDTEAAFVYSISQGRPEHYKFFATSANDIGIGFSRHRDLFAREVAQTLSEGARTRSWIHDIGINPFAKHSSLVSGFAPIRDASGNVVGAVGVDIAMDEALTSAKAFLYTLLPLLGVLTAAMTTFLLWQTRRSVMRPLEAITIASGKLADGETKLPELPVERDDELGLLARHFNQVARSVNSLTVGFIGTASSQRLNSKKQTPSNSDRLRGGRVPTAGLSGKYLATAQGINMVLTILDTLDCMVYVVDPETKRFIFYSRKFGEHFGIDPERAWSMRCWEAIGYSEPCSTCKIQSLGLANVSFPSCEYEEFDEKTQTWLWVKNWLIHWFDGRVVYLSENRDIDEQKRWEEKRAAHERTLRESTRIAEEANQMKTTFLANMSHEIRTPLNGVIGFSELAMEEPGTPEKTREYLRKITDSGESLLQLINDILDVSKIETGQIDLEEIPFSIHDVFTLCETISQPKAQVKGIELIFYEEPLMERQLVGDPTKLRQVLLNLISNAIKFTAKGAVKVKCLIEEMRKGEVTLLFEVRDNGIGMTTEQMENIFKPFAQADGSITRKYGGTGLGLSISKNLVSMMGGEISVRSTPGSGSAFTFTVPVKMLDLPAKTNRKAETTVIKSRPIFEGDALVCEDNRINQDVIAEHLRRVGLRPVIAENGEVGVEFVRKRREMGEPPFAVILMDIHMPKMDGLETTRILRRMNTPSPIVALTANVMTTERERYLREGMADCLGKPFTSKKLWRCLMRFLSPVRLVTEASERRRLQENTKPVNRATGLAHAANNPDLYERQLRRFVEEQKDFSSRLAAELIPGREKDAHRMIHTLKGISALIGADALSGTCARLEEAMSENHPEEIEASRKRVEGELSLVLEYLSSLEAGEGERERADENASVDPDEAVKLLTELLPLLRSNDASALEYGGRVSRLQPIFPEEASKLAGYLEEYDFEMAAGMVDRMLGGLHDRQQDKT